MIEKLSKLGFREVTFLNLKRSNASAHLGDTEVLWLLRGVPWMPSWPGWAVEPAERLVL